LRRCWAAEPVGHDPGLILVHTVHGICFTTLFFRNYFVTIPGKLVKAAQIDGAGFLRIFISIMLPAALPRLSEFVCSRLASYGFLGSDTHTNKVPKCRQRLGRELI
jgi:ABC-type maltose transport system permease subunit